MTRRTRRDFLSQSMITAAAAGASLPLLAAEQSKSPSEKLSVAVVGVNGRGRSHIGGFAGRNDTEVTHLCDADVNVGNSRIAEVARKQGRKPEFVQDIRKLLDDKSIDIISIATPNHWHALGAIWAIQAGKHVYVEKPVSHNVSEGRRIVEVARKQNKICQTGTQCRSMSGMRAAIEFVQKGGIGEVKLARGLCYKRRKSIGKRGNYPVPSHIDYDLWAGPAPKAPVTRPRFHYDWHWQWHTGNGDLGNQGIHQMDICRWGLGLDGLCDHVMSYGGRFGYEKDEAGETANTQVATYIYGDKSIVFEVRGLETPALRKAKVGVIFEGSEGSVVMWSYTSGAAYDRDGDVLKTFNGGGDHYDNFLKAVRSGDPKDLTADIEEGHYSSALCHLANISYLLGNPSNAAAAKERVEGLKSTDKAGETLERTLDHLKSNGVSLEKHPLRVGAALEFDPKTETFPGNGKANQLLTREYRKGYEVPAAGKV